MYITRAQLGTFLIVSVLLVSLVQLLFIVDWASAVNKVHLHRRQATTTELIDESKDVVNMVNARHNSDAISKEATHNNKTISTKASQNNKIQIPETKFGIQRNLVIYTNLSISKTAEVFPSDSTPPITINRGFVIENVGLCSSYLSLTYLIMVHTAPYHFERRKSLRDTWAHIGAIKGENSRTIFLIGRTRDMNVQASIEDENKAHRDIVQGDFYDDYRNLTLKAVMGLKWVVKNCPNAQYVIKTDDDVFVNIFQVQKTVFPVLAKNRKQVVCLALKQGKIGRVRQRAKSGGKWDVSHKYFNKLTRYPMPFCFGFAVFYTTSLAADLLKMAETTPFFRLDDVYVYGILLSKVKGSSWRSEGHRFFRVMRLTSKVFLQREDSLVGTVRTTDNMVKMWHAVQARKHL